jgi:hypothetical protein
MPGMDSASDVTRAADRFALSRHIVSAKQGNATVLLDTNAGTYYTLSGVGPLVWEMLGDRLSLAEIVDQIARSHDVPAEVARADVQTFIAGLSAASLIRPA